MCTLVRARVCWRGKGALPLAWDQQFHFVCGPHFSLKQQITFTLLSICLSTWVENRQPNRFPSCKCFVRGSDWGEGQGDDTHVINKGFFLLPINSEEEFGVGFFGWLVWGFLMKPN